LSDKWTRAAAPVRALCLGTPYEPRLDLEHLARGEERVEHDLLRDDADRALALRRLRVDVEAPDVRHGPSLVDRPARMLISVDLPAPFGQAARRSALRHVEVTSSSASLPARPCARHSA
jgi:hypothetical protein